MPLQNHLLWKGSFFEKGNVLYKFKYLYFDFIKDCKGNTVSCYIKQALFGSVRIFGTPGISAFKTNIPKNMDSNKIEMFRNDATFEYWMKHHLHYL